MLMRTAVREDIPAVLSLYRSVIGRPFCVWNEEYPGMLEIETDLAYETLFLFYEDGILLGAVSVVPENELDGLPQWSAREKTAEIARVVVAPAHQGNGYAARMVQRVLKLLRLRGFCAVHLSAAERNIPACKTYDRLGFAKAGEADLYGHHFFLMEKQL